MLPKAKGNCPWVEADGHPGWSEGCSAMAKLLTAVAAERKTGSRENQQAGWIVYSGYKIIVTETIIITDD